MILLACFEFNCKYIYTDYDDNLLCIGYVVTKQLEVDNEADDEIYVFVKDVSYSLGIQSEIQIKIFDKGIYKLSSADSKSTDLTGWIEKNVSMMFDFGEVFFVKSKDSLCTIDRVDNTPKTILVKKTKNKEKTRGGIDVFITIYGVPTKLLREDGTILDRIGNL